MIRESEDLPGQPSLEGNGLVDGVVPPLFHMDILRNLTELMVMGGPIMIPIAILAAWMWILILAYIRQLETFIND